MIGVAAEGKEIDRNSRSQQIAGSVSQISRGQCGEIVAVGKNSGCIARLRGSFLPSARRFGRVDVDEF